MHRCSIIYAGDIKGHRCIISEGTGVLTINIGFDPKVDDFIEKEGNRVNIPRSITQCIRDCVGHVTSKWVGVPDGEEMIEEDRLIWLSFIPCMTENSLRMLQRIDVDKILSTHDNEDDLKLMDDIVATNNWMYMMELVNGYDVRIFTVETCLHVASTLLKRIEETVYKRNVKRQRTNFLEDVFDAMKRFKNNKVII